MKHPAISSLHHRKQQLHRQLLIWTCHSWRAKDLRTAAMKKFGSFCPQSPDEKMQIVSPSRDLTTLPATRGMARTADFRTSASCWNNPFGALSSVTSCLKNSGSITILSWKWYDQIWFGTKCKRNQRVDRIHGSPLLVKSTNSRISATWICQTGWGWSFAGGQTRWMISGYINLNHHLHTFASSTYSEKYLTPSPSDISTIWVKKSWKTDGTNYIPISIRHIHHVGWQTCTSSNKWL